MSLANSAKNFILGSTTTAIITIRDFREKAAEMNLGETGGSSTVMPSLPESELMDAVPLPMLSNDRRYKVQFNPKELLLNGQQPMDVKSNLEGSDKDSPSSRKIAHEPAKVTLTMNLVFDEVNLFDCFTSEKFSPGAANLIKNVATMGAKALGKVWSVRPQVEAFIAALRNPYTRMVEFTWGEFSFEGNITNLSAEYTMFSIEGHPVRANLRLRLVNEKNDNESDRWIKDFDKAFGGAGMSNYTSADGYVGNVLNMGAFGL
ncbi:MAG: hypothetical protein FWG83_01095 [Oscillospiraceae bacterium]|nr:hypothetical protein [Oscillospiraceae bacterium]